MKRHLLFAATMVAALSSCSQNSVDEVSASAQTPITFSTYNANAVSKVVTEDEFADGSTFKVSAVFTGSDAYADDNSLTTCDEFMMNDMYTYDGSGEYCTSDGPVKYWPNDDGDKLSFFAVSCNAVAAIVGDLSLANDVFSYTFTPEETTKDILVASALNRTETDQEVELVFKHLQSKLAFYAATAGDYDSKTTVTIKEVALSSASNYPQGGTYTFDDTADNGGSFAPGSATAFTGKSWTHDNVLGTTPKQLVDASLNPYEYYMLCPADATNGEKITVTVKYTVDTIDNNLNTGSSAVENVATFEIQPTGINTVYNYTLEVSLNEVKVTGVVSTWDGATVEEKLITVDVFEDTVNPNVTKEESHD